MKTLPIRLAPGQDLRAGLHCAHYGCGAAGSIADWQFTREPDAATGYDELVIRRQG